ncbi:hypothetical protein FGADI_12259 [Fusarium gaditjirri]|uniref:Uncharacterized protein n=1 Tax=Fusarium gaditjirri TaxID=282569 RepID=A0A8H4SSU5_9HYPO|nr:hypothetical protein FGADI_12259 [Fusarium gaditjirri]
MGAPYPASWACPSGPSFLQFPPTKCFPIHGFDDTPFMRKCPILWTIRFDEILDADMLNEALGKHFEMDGWRRLVGRIRLNVSEFIASRCNRLLSKSCRLPIGIGPGAPTSFEDLCSTDAPQFSLHVVTFQDGTLVSLTFSHMTTDLGGLSAILEAWCSILAGTPEEVAKYPGYKDDVMAWLYRAETTEKSKTDGSLLSGGKLAVWALRAAYDGWMYPLECRNLRVPAEAINAIVAEARSEISLEKTADGNKPFVSENDVVLALFNRSVSKNGQDLPIEKVSMLSSQAVVEYLTEGQIKAAAKAAYESQIKR